MSATTEQRNWLKDVLGFDIEAAGGQKQAKGPAPENETPEGEGKRGFTDFLKRKVAEAKGERPPLPKDKELGAKLKELDDKISDVEKLGLDIKQLVSDQFDCLKAANDAEKLKDKQELAKAIARVKTRVQELIDHATALETSAKSVMGKSKDAPTADQKSAIYEKALEDHYGLTITVPPGMTNTHFDRVFDMFGTVPLGDAKQDKLKKLQYSAADDDKGSGAYSRADLYVEMGDFGDATGMENYQIEGEVLPANSFNVTTLHEIGHAVDNKNSIMAEPKCAKTGCGGWKSETVDSIAGVYLSELKKTPGLSKTVNEAAMLDAIKTALRAGTTAKPDTIEQADWEKVIDFLTAKCLPIRSANSPWFKGTQIVVDGRVYQQAYSNAWWSYEFGARASTKVNNYQWRAPGEWFAEIYAISWLAKKKPPSGVDASIADYMWKG